MHRLSILRKEIASIHNSMLFKGRNKARDINALAVFIFK
ncbi:hypothetical protein CLHUN_29710 [Ruminiclostridium hungatei]|uniref:Uncharacterized protein n=1 Tax=Ruminiclostridium hungatei TaxID=48256 RepID=A0A1V4SIZ5_RUMHU|nr:hypothetical protein CLHUN_29710 [Ruminiclostridium hungatei]